jgi:hypothetical protein
MLTLIALAIAIIIALIFMITMAIYVAKYKSLQNKCSPYEDNTEEVDKFLSNKQEYLNAVAGHKECEKNKLDLDLCSRDKSTCAAQTEAYLKERDQNKRDLDACRSGAAVCAKEKEDALRNIQNSSASIANCMRDKTQLTTEKVSAETQLAQCNKDRQTCNTERVAIVNTANQHKANLDSCNSAKISIQSNLDKCNTSLTACNTNLTTCDKSLKACQSQIPVPCLYGPWIGDKCLPAVTNKLTDGRIVYLAEDGAHTKMVASNGEAKYYVGKIAQFDAAKWTTYTTAGTNYKLRVCKPECVKGCDASGNCIGVTAVAPAVAPKYNWTCVPGFDYPVSLNENGDVQCMSADAKNCIPGGCMTKLASPPSPIKPLVCGEPHKAIYGTTGYDSAGHWCNTTQSGLLRQYSKVANMDYAGQGDIKNMAGSVQKCQAECDKTPGCKGFVHNGSHCWLKDQRAVVPTPKSGLTYYYAGVPKWQCVPGFDYPVSLDNKGDVQCMSIDGKNCLPGGCQKNLTTPPQNILPLVCGEPHKAMWGSTGYDNPAHWCNTTRSAIQKRYVTLYQHGGFGGYAVNIGPGKYSMVDLQKLGVQNNDVSSLKVSGGAQYILFDGDNFQGSSVSGSTDMAGVPAGFNDVLSSIIVS